MIRILTIAAFSAVFCLSLAASAHADSKKDKKKAKPKDDIEKKEKSKGDIPLEVLAEKRAKAINALGDHVKGEVAGQISLVREHLAKPDLDVSERRMLIAQHNKLVAAYNAELPVLSTNANKSADAYNKQGVAEYNRLVEKLNQDVAEYNRLVEKYNKTKSKSK